MKEKSDVQVKFEKMQELASAANNRRVEIVKLINAYNEECGVEMLPTHVEALAKDLLIFGTIEGLLRAQEGAKNVKRTTEK